MKALVSRLGVGLAVLTGAGLCVNTSIRVADESGSHGIVEQWLLGTSATSAAADAMESSAATAWEEAADLSDRVAMQVARYGPALLDDPELDAERLRLVRLSQAALAAAQSIPDSVLAASNPTLPGQYRSNFIAGIQAIGDGLAASDRPRVLLGIDRYNAFLLWMQSQSRADFEPIR